MSNNRRLVFNTRERATSTDQNDASALHNYNLDESIVSAAASGSDLVRSSAGMSGVIDGFECTPASPGTNSILTVSPGVGYKVGTPPSTLDSRYRRVELTQALTVDLQSFRESLPKWVCVSIQPGTATETAALRDQWQPSLSTFTQVNVPKVVGPSPSLVVTQGTAATVPVLPDGVPGVIPLCYVLLAASPATSIAEADVVMCRPLYSSVTQRNIDFGDIHGGGVEVTGAVPTAGVNLRPARGELANVGKYSIGSTTTSIVFMDLNDNNSWVSGQSYTDLTSGSANAPVYIYAVKAPYPTGHDADIVNDSREFSDSTGSLSGVGIDATRGVAVVASRDAPSASMPYSGGRDIVLQNPAWGTGGTAVPGSVQYLGTVSYLAVQPDGAGLAPQRTWGNQVRFTAISGDVYMRIPSPSGTAITTSEVNQSHDPSDIQSNGNCLPPNVLWVVVNYQVSSSSGAADLDFRLADQRQTGAPPLVDAYNVRHVWDGGQVFRGEIELYTNDSTFSTIADTNSGSGSFRLILQGYTDPYLSRR